MPDDIYFLAKLYEVELSGREREKKQVEQGRRGKNACEIAKKRRLEKRETEHQ